MTFISALRREVALPVSVETNFRAAKVTSEPKSPAFAWGEGMNRHPFSALRVSITKLAISVKANFGVAKVMPELKQAVLLRGVKA